MKNEVVFIYTVLLIHYGISSKNKTQEKLPMVNHVLSYPVSIFVDKLGNVRRIETGFNDPGTGEVDTEYVKEFEAFVGGLLSE